ncbi:hypothetical protein [Amycolatopsis marina]|nr:hypothetical protein [Amycolatopsis marina]
MRNQPDGGFFGPEMERADRELDDRIDQAFSQAREVRLKAGEIAQKVAEDSGPPTAEEVERIRKFVLGHALTDEWQRVIDLINRGELTWREVVEGLATGGLDHRVAAAFDSLSAIPPADMEKLIEIGVLPTEPSGAQAENKPEERQSRRDNDEVDEESYFDDPLSWRRS